MSGAADSWLMPRREPLALVALALGASSIATLLLYFYGVLPMGQAVRWLLLPAVALLAAFAAWARKHRPELSRRILAGLWAGALATLAYDLVRVPISASGLPVFKAISYFGTVILDQTRPTVASELVGWSYHLSNGIGFGLMYVMIFARQRLWSALVWGVTLEVAMLLTPYAEVFGYRISPRFLAITVGAHVVYGIVLWACLRLWTRLLERPRAGRKITILALLAPLGVGLVAADFFDRHAESIPSSPPAVMGEHLYTTWNVLEPDRVVVLWLLRRYSDPRAHFHYVEPFSHVGFGRPVDTPEADVRRGGARAATEVFLEDHGLTDDAKLRQLAEMTHLFEIARWRLPSRPEAFQLGERLVAAVGDCTPETTQQCVDRGFAFLDDWYAE